MHDTAPTCFNNFTSALHLPECIYTLCLQAKHLQVVSGVSPSSYWLATFAWDLLNCLPVTVLIVVVFLAFNDEGYREDRIGAVFLLVVRDVAVAVHYSHVLMR